MLGIFTSNQFKLVPPPSDHDDEETKAMGVAFNNPRYSYWPWWWRNISKNRSVQQLVPGTATDHFDEEIEEALVVCNSPR